MVLGTSNENPQVIIVSSSSSSVPSQTGLRAANRVQEHLQDLQDHLQDLLYRFPGVWDLSLFIFLHLSSFFELLKNKGAHPKNNK